MPARGSAPPAPRPAVATAPSCRRRPRCRAVRRRRTKRAAGFARAPPVWTVAAAAAERRRAGVRRPRSETLRSWCFLAPAFDALVQEGAQPAQRALDPVLAHAEAARAGRAPRAVAVGRLEQRAAAFGQAVQAVPQRVDVARAVA